MSCTAPEIVVATPGDAGACFSTSWRSTSAAVLGALATSSASFDGRADSGAGSSAVVGSISMSEPAPGPSARGLSSPGGLPLGGLGGSVAPAPGSALPAPAALPLPAATTLAALPVAAPVPALPVAA